MTIWTLVSAMHADAKKLSEKMNIQTEAIIINQGNEFGYEEIQRNGRLIRCYSFMEKGVGLSRNNALLRSEGDISLFSDDDIRYISDYHEKILDEFSKHPEADMIFFNVHVQENRKTYENIKWKRVHLFNSGRYPTYSLAVKTKKLHQNNITFSLLFGGGAPYSNGEDSLFIKDCLKKGLKAYGSPIFIGEEEAGESTWFTGYNEKFFYDRGVLYHYLYGALAPLFGLRFIWAKKSLMCKDINAKEAYRLLKKGINEAAQ